MKKRLLCLICLFLALSIFLCGCYSKYDNLIDAIEEGDFSKAESEFAFITSELMAEENANSSNGDKTSADSNEASGNEAIIKPQVKVIAINTDNFFDYFYIEKKKVPYITDSGKTIMLNLPSYITLKKDYTLAYSYTDVRTRIAIEFSAEFTYRYCVADENFKEVLEVGEPYEFQYDETEHKTMTISAERTSVYAKGMAGSSIGDRHFNHVFDNFEILRAIGTLCIVDK